VNLALRFFARDWRAGELGVLLLALVIAVASVTSVGFFVERMRNALSRDAHQLLGGDLLLQADQPLAPGLRQEAERSGLRVADSVSFMSMARTPASAHLASIKAVDAAYPLRGRLRIGTRDETSAEAGRSVAHGPPRGALWMDPRLARLAGVQVGDMLELGDARFRVDAFLLHEPDQGLAFLNLAPRVLLALDDLPATGLLQPGSRITYQRHFAGGAAAVEAFRAALQPRLARGQQLRSLEDARPEVRIGLERARTFLGLAALLAVALSAVAVWLAARRYVRRHYDGYALLRCLGASQWRLTRLFLTQFVLLGAVAGALGAGLGYAVQAIIALLVGDLLPADAMPPALLPALHGLLTGYLLLFGFALPPLLQLKAVPALRVLRRERGAPRLPSLLAYALGLATLAALLAWQTADVSLTAYVLAGLLAAVVVFAVAAQVGLRASARLGGRVGFAWRHGLANLRRRAWDNTVQVVALALALTVILLLGVTRVDMLAAWRAQTPADAPNRFILNIQPDQRQALGAYFGEHGLAAPTLYPMVRARLLAINERPLRPEDYVEDRARRLVEREFNLSCMDDLPAHNRISAGRWFDPRDLAQGALSVEAGIAETLNLRLGDRLTWSVAGETFSAPITSLRALAWDSMQVNFFVIATPSLIGHLPASHLSSVHVPAQHAAAMDGLARAFPNLSVIDTTRILAQLLSMLDHMLRAVELVFLLALAAGVLVLYAALLATRDERQREAALLRALGARRRQVLGALRVELLLVGVLAGALAALASAGMGMLLAERVFRFDYTPGTLLWLAGPLAGLLCALLNVRLAERAALAAPPGTVLRED
jgi:putative ABC transport system permease protein